MIRNLIFIPFLFALAAVFVFSGTPVLAADAEANVMPLPAPATTGGKLLMEALSERHSERAFSDAEIPPQELSNLLWATWGINRKDGRRTAPTARNSQAVEVYVAMKTGVWQYDAAKNTLNRVLQEDVRDKLKSGDAPITLLYAAPGNDPHAGMHAGSLYQNAGLYCASAGFANVVKTTGARALDGVLTLPEGYKILVIQSVGWPKQ